MSACGEAAEIVLSDSDPSEEEDDYETDLDTGDDDDDDDVANTLPKAKEAVIARDRSFNRSCKPKSQNRTRVREGKSTRAPRVNPNERIVEFPNEHLCISAGKLFCGVCRTVVQTKKSIVRSHVLSKHHLLSKERRVKSKNHQATITKSWKVYQKKKADELKGTGLTKATGDTTVLRRANVVESFLKAGVALTKIDHLRPLLGNNNLNLTHSSHMAQLVPFLLEVELEKLKEEIKQAQHVAVIFDGTTHLGEAFAIIIRYVDASWCIQQRLVRMHVLAKSMQGTEMARELIACLSTFLQIPANKPVAFVRDGASVNTVAVRHVVDLLYPHGCSLRFPQFEQHWRPL